jgi:stage II sporulation protein D
LTTHHTYPHFDGAWQIAIADIDHQADAEQIASELGLDDYQLVTPENNLIVNDGNKSAIFSYKVQEGLMFWTDTIIGINDRNYRGQVFFNRVEGSDLTVINQVPIEDYLKGVVPREMPYDWPIEALKAQAIVARNFVYASQGSYPTLGFDVTDDTNSQVYGGFDDETPETTQAVQETEDMVLKHDDQLIIAYYHANSGGYTENVENIWSNPLPYLVGVRDEYSLNTPKTHWTKSYTTEAFEQQLKDYGYDIGTFETIEILERTPAGRVVKLKVTGSKDTIVLLKEEPRKIFGYTILRSMKFDIASNNQYTIVNSTNYFSNSIDRMNVITSRGTSTLANVRNYSVYNGNDYTTIEVNNSKGITFEGMGYGHGIGLSQWGAMNMAQEGYSREEILTHYYQDTYLDRRE